jgi:hypothetical protein
MWCRSAERWRGAAREKPVELLRDKAAPFRAGDVSVQASLLAPSSFFHFSISLKSLK